MSTVFCEPTPAGTLIVAPADGPVAVEAWVGRGTGDEAAGEAGLAHLAEHVALAVAERSPAGVALRRAGGGVDGFVTPDATVFRALAPAGAARSALAALAVAVRPVHAPPAVVAAEAARIRTEERSAGDRRESALGASGAAVERWWQTTYSPLRTTVAVRGGGISAARDELSSWLPRERQSPSAVSPSRTPIIEFARVLAPMSTDDLAALVLAAATTHRDASPSDVIALRDRILWIGPPPARPFDRAAIDRARAAATLPWLGVDGLAGELAAGHHLFGDLRWAARLRLALATTSPASVTSAVARHLRPLAHADRSPHLLRRRVAQAPVMPAPPAPSTPAAPELKRATLPGGTRVIAARIPGEPEVAIRVAWDRGFAHESPADRGVVSLVAATAPLACASRDAAAETAALGGELAGVAGRWTSGLRSRWPAAAWRDGLALVTACITDPAFDAATVTRERVRLISLARGVAGSPARRAFVAYLAARWGTHPLARDPLAAPAELAAIHRSAVERWWRTHQPLATAVIVVAGDLDPDDAVAAVRAALAPHPTAPSSLRPDPLPPPPPLPPVRQHFLDGPPDTAAVVIGLPGLARTHADRPLLDALAAILSDPRGRLRAATSAAGIHDFHVAVVDGPDAGYLALQLQGPPSSAAAAVAATATVLDSLAADGPTPSELTTAVAALSIPPSVAAHADSLARATLFSTPTPVPLDAASLHRVAASLLRFDDALITTVRPPDRTPAVRHRALRRRRPEARR